MVTKGTGGVVVLAVDVRADSAADGDLAGTRQDRNPQAVGQSGLHELVKGDATVDVDNARLRIDGVDLVEGLHVDDEATGVLRGVTVGTAHTAGDDATAQVGGLISVVLSHLGDGSLDDVDVWGGQNVGVVAAVRPQPWRDFSVVCSSISYSLIRCDGSVLHPT